VEILIIAFLVYSILAWMKTTRSWRMLRGLVVICLFLLVVDLMEMTTIIWITRNVLGFAVTAIIVAMQPELRQALDTFKAEASLGEARNFLMSAKDVKGLKVLTAQRDGLDANALRKMGDFLRDKEPGVVGVMASVNDGKITFQAVCGKEAVPRGVKAGDIIKAIAPVCGGKGGGKPDSAMGGGTDVLKLDDALAMVDDFVAGKLN